MAKKAKVKPGRKTEIVELTFKKEKDGSLLWELGGVAGDSFSDTVGMLCETGVKIKLEILPNVKGAKDKDFPGVDLRHWRGQVIRQVT